MIIFYETVLCVIITAIETRNSFENKSRGNLLIQKNTLRLKKQYMYQYFEFNNINRLFKII